MITPRHSTALPDRIAALALLRDAFAYMEGRIDPFSSLHRQTADTLAGPPAELWVFGEPLAACMVLTPHAGHLYLGKLAVAPTRRGQGLARTMLDAATRRARDLNLSRIRLQSRVELTEVHATFAALGFSEVARTAHPGFDRPTSITMERPI